jgi:hypothetical protein
VFVLVPYFTFPNGYNIPTQSSKFLQNGFISFTILKVTQVKRYSSITSFIPQNIAARV